MDTDRELANAWTAFRTRNYQRAHLICQQVLGQSKKNPGALHLMGLTLQRMNRSDEALPYLQRCATLCPKDPQVHLVLGRLHMAMGKHTSALRCFERVLKIDRRSLPALASKAAVLERRGTHEKAIALLEPLVRAGREDAECAAVLARCLNHVGRDDEAVEAIGRHLHRPETAPETRRTLGFALGKIKERREAYDDAFDAYRLANEAVPEQDDPDKFDRRLDELIEVYGPEPMQRAARARHDLAPVLIVGMPRTGSTLVERIIDAHPDAFGAGEHPAMVDLIGSITLTIGSHQPYPRCVADLGVDDADTLGQRYVDALRDGNPAPCVVDKFLQNYEHLGLAALIVPRARIIDCRRDPVNTCTSCYMEALPLGRHPYASTLEGLGRRYRAYERIMAHWASVLTVAMLRVQYEDLVADPDAGCRRIIEFCGLEWDDRCARPHESKREALTLSREQVRKPIYRSSVDRAARFGAHLDPLRSALAGT